MPVACILITHLPAKAELARLPHLAEAPLIIAVRNTAHAVVEDRFPNTLPSHKGESLQHALSRQPDAIILDADHHHYRQISKELTDALLQVSDIIEETSDGVAYASITGLETLYGGREATARALLKAVPAHLSPRAGTAQGKFPAYAAARLANPMSAVHAPDNAAPFLAPMSVTLLPLTPKTIAALQNLGLHTLGQAAKTPPGLLAARFGNEGELARNLAAGQDIRPVIPAKPEQEVTETIKLPDGTATVEILLQAAERLTRRACASPVLNGRNAAQATLQCEAHDAPTWTKTAAFHQPTASWQRAMATIRPKLAADPPQFSPETMTIILSGISGEMGRQTALLPEFRDNSREILEQAERRLQALHRNGPSLHRIVNDAPWHPAPELRTVRVPLDPRQDPARSLLPPHPVEVQGSPEGEPAAILRHNQWKPVAQVEDQWDFDLWWLPQPLTREYFVVRHEDGQRATLFRDLRSGRWFRQGG